MASAGPGDAITAAEAPIINEKALKLADNLTNGMLRDYIADLEQQKTKLLLSVKEYRQKYEQQKSDQNDIYFYLNKKLDENYETISALEEQILSEQADRESQERLLEKRIHILESEAVAMEAKYLSKLNEAEEKLNKLKEFGENKEELDRNLRKLLDTLEEERKQFRAMSEEMDRRSVQEKERIKKDCARQFEEYKESLQADADQKLSTKTKQTQAMNAIIKSELSYQSKQADHVLLYNQKILERDRDLRQQLELAQTTQTEMVNRLALYQRLIKQLNERVLTEEAQSAESIKLLQRDLESKDHEIQLLTSQLNELQSKLHCELDQQRNVWAFLSTKYKKLTSQASYSNSSNSLIDLEDKILYQLISLVIQKYPERFPQITMSQPKVGLNESGGITLPQIIKKPASEFEISSSTTTGIFTWDNARSSAHQDKWWASVDETHTFQAGPNSCRSVAVQTDGYLLPYPPDSTWLRSHALNESPSMLRDSLVPQQIFDGERALSKEDSHLVGLVHEMSQSYSAPRNTSTGDPLSKKKSSYRTKAAHQSNGGRNRHAKKVYVDPNTFIRDEDLTDSLSTIEISSHPSLFSVSGKSIAGRVVPTKSKPPSSMKPHPPGESTRLSDNVMDDNSVISNITLSPRSLEHS